MLNAHKFLVNFGTVLCTSVARNSLEFRAESRVVRDSSERLGGASGPIRNDQVIQSSGTTPAQNGGALPELVTQARGLINAASAAIAASRKEPPATLSLLARMIVSEAKKRRPQNLLIQSIDLDAKVPDWNDVRAAMKVVVRTLG